MCIYFLNVVNCDTIVLVLISFCRLFRLAFSIYLYFSFSKNSNFILSFVKQLFFAKLFTLYFQNYYTSIVSNTLFLIFQNTNFINITGGLANGKRRKVFY